MSRDGFRKNFIGKACPWIGGGVKKRQGQKVKCARSWSNFHKSLLDIIGWILKKSGAYDIPKEGGNTYMEYLVLSKIYRPIYSNDHHFTFNPLISQVADTPC